MTAGTGNGTITDNYLTVTKTGTFNITAKFENDGLYTDTSKTIVLTVDGSLNQITTAKSEITKVYDGTEFSVSNVKGEDFNWNGNGSLTIDGYYLSDGTSKTTNSNSGSACDGAAPVYAGDYLVKVQVSSDGTYLKTPYVYMPISITKKSLDVKVNKPIYTLQNEAMPTLADVDIAYDGFVNNETASVLGETLSVVFSPDNTSTVAKGTVTPQGLTSNNYEIRFVPNTFVVTGQKFNALPYDVSGSNNGKTDDELWYNGNITFTPNEEAGLYRYISVSTDGGDVWSEFGTSASISQDYQGLVKIKLSTTGTETGMEVSSFELTTSSGDKFEPYECKIDKTAPTIPSVPDNTYGLHFGRATWINELLSEISFTNYFNTNQNIYLTVLDDGSGIDKIYYYRDIITDKNNYVPLTSDNLDNLAKNQWIESNGNSANYLVLADNTCVVYAYAVDKAGNKSKYISSQGLVADTTAPVINSTEVKGITDNKATIKLNVTDDTVLYDSVLFITDTKLTSDQKNYDYIGNKIGIDHSNPFVLIPPNDEHEFTGLTPNTKYYYYIYSIDNSRNASEIYESNFTTAKILTTVITNPSVTGQYGVKTGNMEFSNGVVKSTIDENTILTGEWSFAAADKEDYLSVNNTKSYTVTFTPSDTTLAPVSCEVTPEVQAANPVITLTDKLDAVYTGDNILVAAATVQGATFTGALVPSGTITYTYYTDSECTNKTTIQNAGTETGNAPVYIGTYYVKATITAAGNYTSATSNAAKLIIDKATPTVTMQGELEKNYDTTNSFDIEKSNTNGYTNYFRCK